ncbi:MAG TPA: F0F1 ATP synthase subunit B [Woeseiaceae bacterium]|jgi:F-type H+-transporting ATPase subunit b|nr:F0F1 ATP synthase subunit B [Woeseiaceae bacterium]
MSINLPTLLGQTIAMVVFVWFCMRYIWPPIMNAIEERQTRIADGLAAADRGQQSLDEARRAAETIVSDARAQATAILDQAHARANEIIAEGKAEGTRERNRQLELARAEVEQEINRAREELRGEVSAIAVASAEKILRREIDPSAHEDILSRLAAEI